jgi:hypothetical protein
MRKIEKQSLLAGLAVSILSTGILLAGTNHQSVGTPNPATYALTTTSTGGVTAYLAGSEAESGEVLGKSFNPAEPPVCLDDLASNIGQRLDSGSATAGDSLVCGRAIYPSGIRDSYLDDDFVFANTAGTPSIPEASSWALMLTGFGGLGLVVTARRSRKNTAFGV